MAIEKKKKLLAILQSNQDVYTYCIPDRFYVGETDIESDFTFQNIKVIGPSYVTYHIGR